MKTFTSCPCAILAVSSLFLGSVPGLYAADLTLQKVPALTADETSAYPENLARHHLGARVEAAGNETANLKDANIALLSGDPTASYALPEGQTTLLVALRQIENVETISFSSVGAKGNVAVATANAKLASDSPQWRDAASQEVAGEVKFKVGPSEAKYVRLTFDLTEPGQIAGFGVYANSRVSDFTAPRKSKKTQDQTASFGFVSYSHTDMHAKARALYVSSGADVRQANRMIDDQTSTSYTFAAEDGTPTTVIDLGKSVALRRLSAVYAPHSGSIEFYVLQSLPTESATTAASDEPIPTPEAAPATFTLTDAALSSMKTVGSATDDGKQGRASVEFPETSGRYVMVRWLPASQQDASFSLAEVAAFGPSANNTLLAQNEVTAEDRPVETEYQANAGDGKTMMDGKTLLDAKDMPGEGPEEAPQAPGEGPAPTLPQPPPFTFVPVLVPTSP